MSIELPGKLRGLVKPHRYKVAYGGRGGGKSWAFAHNGYAVCESMSTPVEQCPVFETWAALAYYVEANYANAGAA